MDHDVHPGAVTCQGLIHAVVNYLIDKVMEPSGPCASYIHGRPLPDGLKAFQYLYLLCAVFLLLL